MKLQLKKKERDREKETESKKMEMRGQTNLIWNYQSAEVWGKKNHRVKSYIYSERVSFHIAF